MTVTTIDVGRRQLAGELSDLAAHVIPDLEKQTNAKITVLVEKHGFKIAFQTKTTRIERLVSYTNYIIAGSSVIGRVMREMAGLIKKGLNENEYENGQSD